MYLSIIAGIVGPWQIILIVFVALLLFGGRKIPELMKGLGEGMKEFKKATRSDETDDKDNTKSEKKDK